jgi:DNA-binding transcriptional MerR regulator
MTSLYNLKAVVRLTGVPAPTLRVWEQRYGTPRPGRNEHGHRVYTDEDLQVIHALKRLTDRGVTIGQAVRAVREAPPPAGPGETEVAHLTRALRGAAAAFDERRLAEAWDRTLATLSLPAALGEVILPALAGLADSAAAAERACRRFAEGYARRRLGGLLAGCAVAAGRGSVLAAWEDAGAEIRALAAGALLHARGTPFVDLGPGLEAEVLAAAAERRAARVVLLAGGEAAVRAAEALRAAGAPSAAAPPALALLGDMDAAPDWAVHAGPDPLACAADLERHLLNEDAAWSRGR